MARPDTSDGAALRPAVAAVGLAAAVGGGLALYGLAEAHWYRLRHVHVTGVLHGTTRPLRVLHVSDLHLSAPGGRIASFVARLAEEDYDLVVLTGDLLGAVGMEDDTVSLLATLTAGGRPGVAVLGSNDHFAPTLQNPFAYLAGDTRERGPGARLDAPRLVAGLAREGIVTLDDEVTAVPTALGDVVVSGLHDPHLADRALPSPTAMAGDSDGITHLGLVHAPYLAALDVLVDAGADLLLAGHTHGGQVRVPGIGALVTNCDLDRTQARGLSRHRGVALHVSAGVGTSKYAPVRFACRPEASLLTLLP
jgi:predicted MPP superfamily phosphohydrolase